MFTFELQIDSIRVREMPSEMYLFLVLCVELDFVVGKTEFNMNDPLKFMLNQDNRYTRSGIGMQFQSVYACPKTRSILDGTYSKGYQQDKQCLDKVERSTRCYKAFKPKLEKGSTCGRKDEAILYTFKYDLCFQDKAKELKDIHKLLQKRSLLHIIHNIEPENPEDYVPPETTPLVLYSVCFNATEMETLYTTHLITTNDAVDKHDVLDAKTYIPKLQTGLKTGSRDLDALAIAYKELAEKKYGRDYPTPQLMVPSNDIKPQILRESNLHYLNIRPQWKSKRRLWRKINKVVWSYVQNPLAEIYTATSEILRVNGEDFAFILNGIMMRVPLMWWKLISYPSGQGFIVVLYNVPYKYPMETMEELYLCEQSICDNIDFSIEQSNYIQCCPAKKETLERLNYIGEKEISDDMQFDEFISNDEDSDDSS